MNKLGFLGAGNMAYAIAGAVSKKLKNYMIVPFDISEERISLFKNSFDSIDVALKIEDLLECEAIVLAVKPQMMKEAIKQISSYSGLVISIAAGLKISFFEDLLPSARVIRVMPNTPCLVNQMAAGFAIGSRATKDDIKTAEIILNSAGLAQKVNESQLDAVTGLSGSGPAFFARLAEAFIDAGIQLGLEPDLSRNLTLQTMKGTAALLLEKELQPDELVKMVSSPNGTTIAGREILEASDFKNIIAQTVKAAVKRSKELGK